jgi:hypothetical protein
MLDFINFEILDKTKPFATDVLIQFEETGVNTQKYSFIQDRLDNYNLYIDTKYSMTYETQYNEPEGILLMGIVISIPDRLVPDDDDKYNQLIAVFIKGFQQFHERTMQFLKNKKEGSSLKKNLLYFSY